VVSLKGYLFLFVVVFSSVAATVPELSLEKMEGLLIEDEVTVLQKLIEVNEKRLFLQKKLKEKMELFQRQKEEFILGNQSKKHAFLMVSNAREILSEVKKEHLSYLFSSDYLEELVFFSSIAGKSTPVRP
jgi:hypothetical protein